MLNDKNYSLLCLANNTSIGQIFAETSQRFLKLFNKKVYVHHYLKYIEEDKMTEANETILGLRKIYGEMEKDEPLVTELGKYKMVF